MTELQQNRYDRLLRRVGGMIGPGSMVNDALTELFPMIDVESLNAELSFLSDWRLAFGSTLQSASVGEQSLSQIFNPVDSGMLVVLERVDILTNTDQNIEYGLSALPLTDFNANVAMRDTRPGILRLPVTQLREVQQAGSIATFGLLFVLDLGTFTMEEKKGLFVLAPGTGLTFSTTTANTSFNVTYLWRERVAEPSELKFGSG